MGKRQTAKQCRASLPTVYKYWDVVDDVLKSLDQSSAEEPQPIEEPQIQVQELGSVKTEGEGEKKTEKVGRYVGTGISEVMKTLGSEYAELLKTVTEKTRWFNDALVEIGWLSTLYAFQYARIDPKDISKKVDEFKDSDKFVGFVNKYLTAMIQASTDATNTILNLEKELSKYRDALKVAGALIKGYKRYVKELNKYLEAARAVITKYGLTEEYSNMLMQMSVLESLMALPEVSKQEEREEKGVEVKPSE